MFKGRRLGIVCILIEFQIVDLSLLRKQYYALAALDLHEAMKAKASIHLLRTASMYSGIYSTQKVQDEKVQVCRLFPLRFGFGPGLVFAERRRHAEARVHAAARRSRKASCQPPAEEKQWGVSQSGLEKGRVRVAFT